MTQEEKELLLKDLCARLPYGVKCYPVITNGEPNTIGGYCEILEDFYIREVGGWFNISMIKPYLRPMSSMTDEERDELWHLSEEYFGKAIDKQIEESLSSSNRNESEILEYIASSVIVDWLNVHHFDYRGLIPMGLALEAPEGVYND